MSDLTKKPGQMNARPTYYTGDDYIPEQTPEKRRPRREAANAAPRPKRRVESLKEEDIQRKIEAEARAKEEKIRVEIEEAERAKAAEREAAEKAKAAEREALEKAKAEKLAAERAEKEAAQKAKAEKIAKAKAQKEAAQKAKAEKLAAEKAAKEASREAARKAKAERLEAEKAAKAAAAKEAAEKKAAEKAAKEAAAKEAAEKKAAAEKEAAEKKAAAEKEAAERKAAQEAAKQETAARKAVERQISAEKKAAAKDAVNQARKNGGSFKEKYFNFKSYGVKEWIILCLIVVFVISYTAIGVYFGSHFYSGTEIYGIDCSRRTVDEVKQQVKQQLSGYVLEIQERDDRTEHLTANQIHLEYADDGKIDQVMKEQYAFIWPVMALIKQNQGEEVTFSYDKEATSDCISRLVCMDKEHMIEPKDAYIGPTDTGFEVVSEVMGTTVDPEKVNTVIHEAIGEGAVTVSLDEKGCYKNPELYQTDEQLQKDAADMSKVAGARVVIDLGDTEDVIDASVLQGWITKTMKGEYVIDDVCVTDYVESLAEKYDTFGMPIEFHTTIDTVETLYGGDYGWAIDQDATVIELLKKLQNGYRGSMEPVYSYRGMSHANNGIGYTYVEICIPMQEMWCYQDGELIVDTPVVTGNPSKGNATPSGGVWAIDAKERNATLVGEDYRTPVDYWMPFNGNIGIHDLQARAYFGGDIYLYAGSHGCVNTPYEAVQQIYDIVSVGTPVIVY